jgi:hypothetical protein
VSTADSRGGRRRARFAPLPVVGVVDETARLFEQRTRSFAVANIGGGIVAGLAAVTVGYVIAAAVTGT